MFRLKPRWLPPPSLILHVMLWIHLYHSDFHQILDVYTSYNGESGKLKNESGKAKISRWRSPPFWILPFTIIQSISNRFQRNFTQWCRKSCAKRLLDTQVDYCRNSRWQPPPSWISQKCCHFITISRIFTKFYKYILHLMGNHGKVYAVLKL